MVYNWGKWGFQRKKEKCNQSLCSLKEIYHPNPPTNRVTRQKTVRTATSLVQQAISEARDLAVEVERALMEVMKPKIIQKRTIMVLGASCGKKERLESFGWT